MDMHNNFVLAHLSDLHLGYHEGDKTTRQNINWREADGYSAFHAMVTDIIKDHEVDAVLIAGDVFHFSDPSNRAIMFAQTEIRRFADAGLKTYILTGNHDVSDVKSELAATALLNDPERGIYSHWESYASHTIAPNIMLHMVSHHLYKEQASTWDKVRPVDGMVNIFTTHGAMIDPLTKMRLHTEQSPREVIIPDDIIGNPNWSYRLLGHIHERGFVGSKDGTTDTAGLKTYYNGSLIRRGFSDADTPLHRGWTKWTVQPDGTMTPVFKQLPQRPQIDFPIIDAKDLTASDITDLIIDNLRSTQHDGITPANAPILRQKILNISSEKKRALDNGAISSNASHALIWRMPMPKSSDIDSDQKEVIGHLQQGVSLTEQYANWLEEADVYKSLHDNIKNRVEDETKRFIGLGQDKVLDEKK
jgi:hypothetical protein